MSRARLVTAFVLLFLAACGGAAPSAAERSREVASWLTATQGVVVSWAQGSISSTAASSNLESTLDMLRRELLTSVKLDKTLTLRVEKAIGLVEAAGAAVAAGDKAAAARLAAELASLARQLQEPAAA